MNPTEQTLQVVNELFKLNHKDFKLFKLTLDSFSIIAKYGTNKVEVFYDEKFKIRKYKDRLVISNSKIAYRLMYNEVKTQIFT